MLQRSTLLDSVAWFCSVRCLQTQPKDPPNQLPHEKEPLHLESLMFNKPALLLNSGFKNRRMRLMVIGNLKMEAVLTRGALPKHTHTHTHTSTNRPSYFPRFRAKRSWELMLGASLSRIRLPRCKVSMGRSGLLRKEVRGCMYRKVESSLVFSAIQGAQFR